MTPPVPPPMPLPDGLWDTLERAYAQPPRAYHHIGHIGEVLAHWATVAADVGWTQPRETYLAVLYHDAIYEPGRKDNEARSALLARDAIARWFGGAGIDAARVAWLIELTARHGQLEPEEVDPEAALFLDCDMAILGADPARFDAYDTAIAREYRHLPPLLYRINRRRFLKGVLAKPRIYLSDVFHARLDAAARANLRRALNVKR